MSARISFSIDSCRWTKQLPSITGLLLYFENIDNQYELSFWKTSANAAPSADQFFYRGQHFSPISIKFHSAHWFYSRTYTHKHRYPDTPQGHSQSNCSDHCVQCIFHLVGNNPIQLGATPYFLYPNYHRIPYVYRPRPGIVFRLSLSRPQPDSNTARSAQVEHRDVRPLSVGPFVWVCTLFAAHVAPPAHGSNGASLSVLTINPLPDDLFRPPSSSHRNSTRFLPTRNWRWRAFL